MATEIFNDARMSRCMSLAHDIFEGWCRRGVVDYTARPTQPIDGIELDELRKVYFSVGPDRNNLTDIPFHDMLIVFECLRMLNAGHKRAGQDNAKQYKITFDVTTDFPESEVSEKLSWIQFSTPREPGDDGTLRTIRLVEGRVSVQRP